MIERLSVNKKEAPGSGVVEDTEKARLMAEAEDPDREYLTEFKAYIEDPAAYRAAEHARAEEARARGIILHENDADDFMNLYRAGVRTSDLQELAANEGEKAGELYEVDKTFFKDAKPTELKIWITALKFIEKLKERKLRAAEKRAGSKISLANDPRGIVVAEKLQRLQGADDPDVQAYEDAYDAVRVINLNIKKLENLLASREHNTV